MDLFTETPMWMTAVIIFFLRITDVSLGTVRTIAVVQGRIRASVVLGFLEVLVWVTAISQVVINLGDNPVLLLAYASGYAVGNATGILLERRLAWGHVMVSFLSGEAQAIANHVRDHGLWAAVFEGEGKGGSESIVFASFGRPHLSKILNAARRLDPDCVYHVEAVLETGTPRATPVPLAGGWRGRFLRK